MNALCRTRPAEYWETGDDGNVPRFVPRKSVQNGHAHEMSRVRCMVSA